MKNPYKNLESEQEDKRLLESVMNQYYEEIFTNLALYGEKSSPPDTLELTQRYADLLLEKYKSMDLVEPRLKFHSFIRKDSIRTLLKNMREQQQNPSP